MRSTRRLPALLLAASTAGAAGATGVLTACGGDADVVAPTLIPGGGVHDPGIDGVVNVFVIDADSDAPIANATVKVGATEATTDAAGLVIVKDVSGPQTLMVRATGHASAMWVGVDGANVTVPLDRAPPPIVDTAQAQLAGTITGWDALPAPAAGHVRVALVTFSQDPKFGSTANDVTQPPPVGNIPTNACVRLPAGTSPPCAWRLNARAGTIALGVIVIDLDGHGTADESDDSQTITGYALKQPIAVVDGSNQSGLALDLPPASSTVTASVDLGAPPAALTVANAVVGLDLGATGVFRYATASRAQTSVVAPSLAAFAGTSYELLAVAQEPVVDGTAAQSIVLRKGISSPSALAAGEWLPPPTGLASDRTTASFTRNRAEGPYILELDRGGAATAGVRERLLSIAILDDSAQVTLPGDFAPLPAGAVTMRVTTLDTGSPLDLRDFEVDDLIDGAIRFAADTIELR
jgi:hypothetical protein